ncbi:MAG: hypothetical protein EP308_12880 [Burkholderiales bacterium]|nr:MAG: hypothetical protein EP308_12880 [Burkholderiales bacterium]
MPSSHVPLQSPIAERMDWLFDLAKRHALEYASPEAWLARQRYLANHPTAILVMKCMDGRINIPVATRTPKGIILPFRNLGGIFKLGWPHLGETLTGAMDKIVRSGRQALFVITYHYSKGDERRGCAGFHFRTEDARAHTFDIRHELSHLFGTSHGTVYPLVCGFETDEEALVVHGQEGQTLNMAELSEADLPGLAARLQTLLPDMPARMRADLLPLLEGNLRHIAALRQTERALDIEHREWMLCIGRGFDWLHLPNLALIIGPYSPDLADPIRKAAGIIRANMRAGRIPDDGFLVLSSVPYEDIGVDRARAVLKSDFLADFAANVVRQEFPDLAPLMTVRKTVLNWDSRSVEPL